MLTYDDALSQLFTKANSKSEQRVSSDFNDFRNIAVRKKSLVKSVRKVESKVTDIVHPAILSHTYDIVSLGQVKIGASQS